MELLKHEKIQGKYTTMEKKEIDVSYDVFTLATQPGVAERAVKEAQKNVKVQGFRTGKVPKAMLERRLGTHNLYGPYLGSVWDQFCLSAGVVSGYSTELDEIHPRIDGAIVFKVATMTIPVLELSLRDKYEIDVTKDVIDKTAQQLQMLRGKHTTVEPVTGRATVWGDTVVIDFKGSIGGEEEDKDLCAEGAQVEIGSRQIVMPNFEESIVDMNIGETKQFEVNVPEDFEKIMPRNPRASYFAGKTILFVVTMKEIKTKIIPRDDEIAFNEEKDSYEELYAELSAKVFDEIKENLEHVCARASDTILEDNEQLLIDGVQKPLIEHRILSFLDRNKKYFDQLEEEQRKETLAKAVPNITKSVFQDAVYAYLLSQADKNNVEPSNEEIQTEAERFAMQRIVQSRGQIKKEEEIDRLLKDEKTALYRNVQRRKVYTILRDKIEVQLNKENEDYAQASTFTPPEPRLNPEEGSQKIAEKTTQEAVE